MLVAIGKPMMDVIVEVDINFLKKYGVNPNDSKKASESQAELFKEILKLHPKFVPGGSVTNTLRVYQWAMDNQEKVLYIGTVGKDKFGAEIKKQLERENIKYTFLENNLETPLCAVLVSDRGRNRSLISNSSLLSTKLSEDEINITLNDIRHELVECTCFYVPAYSMVIFSNLIKEIIEYLKSSQKKIVINLGATYIVQNYPDGLKYLMGNADIVIGNNEEYMALGRIYNIDISVLTIKDLLKQIGESLENKNGNPTFIVTNAKNDLIVYERGNYKYFEVIPVHNILDTTAAGDAFAAGFLAQYIKNSSLDDCVKCGMACARHVIQHIGCNFDPDYNRSNLFNVI